jgi:hypothetical protein
MAIMKAKVLIIEVRNITIKKNKKTYIFLIL